MKNLYLFIMMMMMFVETSVCQNQLPLIRASSNIVDIRDGDSFRKASWTIMPDLKPDVYTTSANPHRLVFYTNIDSLAFDIRANTFFKFNILLNNKDTAYTMVFAPDYLDLLKNSEAYDTTDKREIPAFTYQDSSNANLAALRHHFNLDSIAGDGSEINKVINLLHWIHYLVPHDGNHENPAVKNALSMITECKKDKRGLNCRGLATVLNECYLSLGIPSRFVTCLPKDSLKIDNDCHVINAVFIKELNKWVWIDPTNDAYVMDEHGLLLSIEEVRERLINGKPLLLNPDANWNRKSPVTPAYYLYEYMAKNLYMLQCYTASEYDTETWGNNKTVTSVTLLPLDYFKQTPNKTVFENKNIKTVFINYKTNNPALFWATPK